MYKTLRIVALLVLVGYMSAGLIKLPKQICKPAKKIGNLIANGVTKCAKKYGLPTRELQKAKKAAPAKPAKAKKATKAKKPKKGKKSKGKKGGKGKVAKKGGKAKVHVKVKITKKQKKSLAGKIVHKLLDFIGCSRRRLSLNMIKNEARILEKTPIGLTTRVQRQLSTGYLKLQSKLRKLANESVVKRRMVIVSDAERHLKSVEDSIHRALEVETSRRLFCGKKCRRKKRKDKKKAKAGKGKKSIRRAFQQIAQHIRNNANKLDTKERRMGFFSWVKNAWNTVTKHVKKAVKHVKSFVKKHIGPAIKWVKKGIKTIGKKAMQLACGALKGICPKACSSVVKTISPLIKKIGIPSKCDATAIDVCKKSCSILCKGV